MQEAEPTATGSSVSLWGSIGFEDHTLAGLAVHHHHKWRRKLQVADAAVLLDRRLFSQPPIGAFLYGVVSGLKIIPWPVLPFITTTSGAANCKWRTQPCSSTAGCSASHRSERFFMG